MAIAESLIKVLLGGSMAGLIGYIGAKYYLSRFKARKLKKGVPDEVINQVIEEKKQDLIEEAEERRKKILEEAKAQRKKGQKVKEKVKKHGRKNIRKSRESSKRDRKKARKK